jgi:hypothetical protein
MKKIAVHTAILLVLGTGMVWETAMVQAETFRAALNASQSSIFAGVDAKRYVTKGYMKYGGNGIFLDSDTKKYEFLNLRLMVGSDTLLENLVCEIGLKSILGSGKERNDDGSIGAVAFSGIAAYRLPQSITPIPIQFSLELSGSPSVLTFLDARNYFDVRTGIDVFIVENASLQFFYHYYNVNMKNWDFQDDSILLGIALEF